MKQELDAALCAKYPKIFPDRHSPMSETCMCWGFECGDGWYDLLDKLCACIQSYIDANHENDPTKQVLAAQVKEKFGTLRFYYRGGDELIAGMVWFAEYFSYSVCEVCGDPGRIRRTGWISVLCDLHAADAAAEAAANEEDGP